MSTAPGTATPTILLDPRRAAQNGSTRRAQPQGTRSHACTVRVRVVDDCPLIVHGLASILASYASGIVLEDAALSGTAPGPVDITLYDPTTATSGSSTTLTALLADPANGSILAYALAPAQSLVEEWIAAGCAGYVDKHTPDEDVVIALTTLATERRTGLGQDKTLSEVHGAPVAWPGKEHGLSRRESDIITLITSGLTNQDISAHTGLSINTVKTYIRSAYTKLDLTRRSQAVRWGMEHSMLGSGRAGTTRNVGSAITADARDLTRRSRPWQG